MANGIWFDLAGPWHITQCFDVGPEEVRRGPGKVGPSVADVVCLAEQVGQAETDVERRVAPVNDFEVENHESAGVNEHVFRTEVAMNQGQTTQACVVD